jgi:hypothetical protein
MDGLSNMPNNIYTVKLIDLIMIENSNKSIGLFIVMEHFETDLKKLLN